MKISKTTIVTIVTFLIALSIHAQQPAASAARPQELVRLSSGADTIQYSLGAFVGQWMEENSFAISNPQLFIRGMNDVLQKKTLAVSDSTIAPIVSAYQLSTQSARSRALEEQLFAALKGKTGVGVLPIGVHYIVVKNGTGVRPMPADTIVINAIGIFPDGTVFEDTFKKQQPITTLTGNLIPGLNAAIQLMPEGSVWRIFIPSVLGYGTAGLANVIPPDAALVFDITLEEVKGK